MGSGEGRMRLDEDSVAMWLPANSTAARTKTWTEEQATSMACLAMADTCRH